MSDVCNFCNDFRRLAGPHHVSRRNPLSKAQRRPRDVEAILIHRSTKLQPIRMVWPGREIREPGLVIIIRAEVCGTAENRPAAVSQAEVVIQIHSTGGCWTSYIRAAVKHRNKTYVKLKPFPTPVRRFYRVYSMIGCGS